MLEQELVFGAQRGPGVLVLLIFVWVISAMAGYSFIKNAYGKKPAYTRSKIKKIWYEIGFRLRFTAGVLLLLFVVFGIIWTIIKW